MKRIYDSWEYKVERVISTFSLESRANDLGRQGWELVSASISRSDSSEPSVLLFKRCRGQIEI